MSGMSGSIFSLCFLLLRSRWSVNYGHVRDSMGEIYKACGRGGTDALTSIEGSEVMM